MLKVDRIAPLKHQFKFKKKIKRPMDCSVKNANYARVMKAMEKILRDGNRIVCSCQRCLDDVAALALNYLPPHYHVEKDNKDEIGSPWVMIETAIHDAIERVNEVHHHDRPGRLGRQDREKPS